MTPTHLPNPSLVAILLVINTKDGPRFVFHYPSDARATVQPTATTWKDQFGDSLWERGSEPSDDEDEDGDVSEGVVDGSATTKSRTRERYFETDTETDEETVEADARKRRRPKGPAWESFLGYSTSGLEHILNVRRTWNKKRFELGLEPLVYLSYPVFVREDGTWKKKRKRKDKKDKPRQNSSGIIDREEDDLQNEVNGSGDNRSVASSTDDTNSMHMFNMVFVMNPPQLEHQFRVDEMFEHVVKRFAKALKYEQARSNWVWKQAETILNLKERAREEDLPMSRLWKTIMSRSSLARAMSEIFLSISSSKIAHVFLNDHFDVSLQIPQIQSVSDLPSYIDPPLPAGAWLTTANSFAEDEESGSADTIAKHFALLLLDEVENIIRDINSEQGPARLSDPLINFVRLVKPTMSFLEISNTHNMSLQTISMLSRHLIYWRRARAIPPLHQKDKYIVSPNADMSALTAASRAYERRFPTLPSLPKMLSLLSGHPRAYSTLIPSQDHRSAYLDILAWLLKGGWVTQLRTFAWVRIPGHARSSADAKIRAEHMEGKEGDEEVAKDWFNNTSPPIQHPTHTNESQSSTPIVVLEPHRANAVESAYIAAVADALPTAELRTEAWPIVLKYLNGVQPLEKIPVSEGRKRKEVWRWLLALEREGVMLCIRHW